MTNITLTIRVENFNTETFGKEVSVQIEILGSNVINNTTKAVVPPFLVREKLPVSGSFSFEIPPSSDLLVDRPQHQIDNASGVIPDYKVTVFSNSFILAEYVGPIVQSISLTDLLIKQHGLRNKVLDNG